MLYIVIRKCIGNGVQLELHEADRLMRIIARVVATSPAGVGLHLIGGFRYRLLDGSQRFSVDIGYHWAGDLDAKQQELLALCRRVILRQVALQTGYQGSASARTGPGADAPDARFIDLRFWKRDNQIVIPIEITRIVCLDPPTIRTADGTVHATPSDADLIESKVIAVFNRVFLQHRDLLDLFLYGDQLHPDSPARLKLKLALLPLGPEAIAGRLRDLMENREYHASAIQKVIDEQVDPIVAQHIHVGGGGRAVLESALSLILRVCPP